MDSKGSYSKTTFQPFQELCQGNVGGPEGWFLISFIMIPYLKEKVYGFEIKTEIIGGESKLVTMMFLDNGHSPTLGKITDIQWE